LEELRPRDGSSEAPISSLEELYERLKNLREHECFEVENSLLEELYKLGISGEEPDSDEVETVNKLGLFLKFEKGKFKLCSYYFIGVWWLKEGETFVRVKPKAYKNKFTDPFKMLLEITQDRYVTDNPHFKKVFKVDTEKPFINLETEDANFLLFLIIFYLSILEQIVKKGLRKGYVEAQKGMRGRIKGKVDLKRTYQKYLTKGLYTRVSCRFYDFTEDFLDNQILKCALVQSSKWIRMNELSNDLLDAKINFLNYAFERITLKPISSLDFLKVKHSPFFPEYKKAIESAKLILKTLGTDPFVKLHKSASNSVPPYLINMPKLFELFVFKKLREVYGNKVKYQLKRGRDIPDFLVEREGIIVDAKYKYIEERGIAEEDLGQIARYGRNKALREIACGDERKEPKLIIAYPVFNGEKEEEEKGYYEVYRRSYEIPHHEKDEHL